jgi:hypothetical protein
MKKTMLAVAAVMITATPPAGAQAVNDFTPNLRMIGDAQGNPIGLRTITPYLISSPATNGMPGSLALRFRVYDPTSANTQYLFQTANRNTSLPVPCVNPISWNYNYLNRNFGAWLGSRHTIVLGYTINCTEAGGEQKIGHATIVYSAIVSSAGQATWARIYNGPLYGANSYDLRSGATLGVQDGVGETLHLSVGTATGARGILLNFSTGALFSNPNWSGPSDRNFNVGNF